MPKYIKLFENFIEEAAPYQLDLTKSPLVGAKLFNNDMHYAIFKLGRVYIATKDSESVKTAPGNVSVTLDSNNPAVQKQLTDLGGKLDAKPNGSNTEPSGGTYTHFSKIHFNLTDTATGDPILKQISNIMSGQPASGTAGTAGTSGTSGTAGKSSFKTTDLADAALGKGLADIFRDKIAKETGKPYDPNSSIQSQTQSKVMAADAKLKGNPEYVKLTNDIDARGKQLKLDPITGKDPSGKIDQVYIDLKNKMSDMITKAMAV
jgi:hypothetical protein